MRGLYIGRPSPSQRRLTMLIQLLKSKIHRAEVTDANVNYEGSLTIDRELMNKVELQPHERVLCGNLANGERFETYAIPGEPGSGGTPGPYKQLKTGLELYHLEMDIGEKEDLASRFPGVVKELAEYGDRIRKELGDSLTKQKGSENRQPGRVKSD